MITVILILSIIFLSIVLYYSLKRINQYEDLIEEVYNVIDFTHDRIKTIDTSGHFESDDEIGFFFEEVKRLQELLDNIFETQEKVDAEEKKKEE